MDTPERNQINTTLSKFEDSPVFNYINSLSPIKPGKSVHITQTFSSLSFSSPPSVFTSPHVSCLKESRFIRRHNALDTLKPEDSSEDANKAYSKEDVIVDSTHTCGNASELQENTDQSISVGDASIEPPQDLKYNSGSPVYDAPVCGDEANSLLELSGEAASDAVFVQEDSKTDSIQGGVLLQGICQIEPKSEGSDCDWVSLIPDATDLLILNSPNEAEAFENEGHCSEHIAAGDAGHIRDNLADVDSMTGNSKEKTDELVSVAYRGMRRRCLDFEMASVRRKNSDDNSKPETSASQTDEENVANEKKLLPAKRNANSQRCILPGIGLHLNALAAFKDNKGIQNENFSSAKITLPSSSSSVLEHQHLSLVPVSSERQLDPSDNGIQPAEDCSQAAAYMAGEDFNPNSPKKKRRKSDPAGDEGCKRCNCKKSKCLKLYCECFAAGVYCIEPCSCQDCFNKPIHEDTVLQTRKQIESRNPLAFAPKVIRSSDSLPEIGDDPNKTPASARHKRGCNCKKSSCLKKYCECYQGGVGCSISCRCEGCKNAFGRKDGSVPIGTEAELEEETEACSDKAVVEKSLQKTENQNVEEPADSVIVSTPLRLSRPLLPMPFSSKGKPPRSFVASISGSGLFANQKLGKANSLWSQAKQFKTVVSDEEKPDILRGDSSPVACIKTCSPNGKRISSPKCELGSSSSSSPSRRGGRKLILQSIPSFPSLTPHP